MAYDVSLQQTFADYLAIKAHNWSSIKHIARSPKFYKYRLKVPMEDKRVLAQGRAMHTAVFEPQLFAREYVIYPGATRRGKEWDAFEAAHEGRTILKQDEYVKAWQCAAAIRKHPRVAEFMCSGEPEQVYTWRNAETKLRCKARMDWSRGVLFDLKTMKDIAGHVVGRTAARLMYYAQLAMYADGAKHKGDVYIVGAESEPPFDVGVFKLSEADLQAGREVYIGCLQRIKKCMTEKEWPGRYPEVQMLALPKYVFDDEDQDDDTYEVVSMSTQSIQ